MKYIKSFKFWIAFFILLYTIFGFIFIPWFLTNKTTPILQEKLGLHVEIGKAKFNPYTFDLEIGNILLKDLSNRPVIGFKNIFIDYMPIGLLEGTFLFGELNIDSPKIYATLKKDGKLNFESIIDPSKHTKSQQLETKGSFELPTITLLKFKITNGNLKFSDLRGEKEFKVNLGPYSFKAHDISTKKDALNAHNFITKINKDGELLWEGGVRLNPLKLYGEISIKNLKLPSFYTYALPDFDASLYTGQLSLKIPYKIDLSKELKLTINDAKAEISNLEIMNNKSHNTIIKIPKIKLDDFNFKWPKKEIVIDKLSANNPYILALLDKNKELSLVKAFSNKASKESNTTGNSSENKWSFLLKNTYLHDATVAFIDGMGNEPIKTDLTKISLHVKDISLDNKTPIGFNLDAIINKKSTLKSHGTILTKPFKLNNDITLKNFNVMDYVAYAKPYVNLDMKTATVDTKTHLEVTYKKSLNLKVISNATINNLLFNTQDNKRLLEWKKLRINKLKYTHSPQEFSIKSLNISEPFVRLHIDKNGTTNFSGIVKESKEKIKEEKKSNIKIKIGPMKLTNGTSDFSDFSLPFPFKTHIHDINGDLSSIDFQTTTPTKLSLTGKIDKYGYADIQGALLPFSISENANLNVLFKNIDLTSLTPYSSKFVGYKIEKGKLSMDLKYTIEKSALVGDNKLNIDTLEVGEIVNSPTATSLPLELAIALLKDADGQIDIDMPVKGDINDPDFSYGGVVWRALGNMITGIVTAPFRMLGNMLGIDGDELKSIDFDRGSALIISTEQEKLNNIQKILEKRPKLKIDVTGGYDDIYDLKQLQNDEFVKIVQKALKTKKVAKEDEANVYGVILQELYIKQFSQEQYSELKKSFEIIKMSDDNKTVIKKDNPQIDVIALNDKMKNELMKNIKISTSTLKKLASQRANSIKNELVKKYKVSSDRINVKEVQPIKAKRDRWIEAVLNINI